MYPPSYPPPQTEIQYVRPETRDRYRALSGIGRELAMLAADGYDLIVAADEPLVDAAAALRSAGIAVKAVETDLSKSQ